jgi:hypothetical protein
MKTTLFTLALLLVCLSVQSAVAQSKEAQDFIANAKLLERKPFDPNAKAAREGGFMWLVQTDQVSVTMCSGTMKLIPEKKNKFKAELTMQQTFGMGVFKLENPASKDDERAAQLAGMESMLRAYEVMLKENEKAKNAELDGLLAKHKSGELKATVDAAFDAGKCSK